MSRVYTSKPAVSRQPGGNKPVPKNPDISRKSKPGPAFSCPGRTTGAGINSHRGTPSQPKTRTYQNSSQSRRMSGPGYSGSAYGNGTRGAYASSSGQQQSLYGQSPTRRPCDRRQTQDLRPGFSAQRSGLGLEDQDRGLGSQPVAERRLEYRGGYSVMPPDETRKRQVEAQARKESEEYERYKEQKKPGHMSYVGTAGGGLTEEQARARAAKEHSHSKFNSLQKRQQYHDEARRKEDMKYEEKKAQAREQSEQNERRERERQKSLDHDRRMKNDAFFRKWDGK
ncbi:epithelial-stromal interaction protein 1-like [Lineus longissimus]|uniref:epithelial-stromal interaction protein 1-like n=1 Tax=Lineus longissimus TaxID=88925 RepID=UPI00315CB8A9